jgi:hypothetical protein
MLSLIKTNIIELLVDDEKNILIFKFTSENYNREDYITILEYFKNFWLLAQEQKIKYYMLFDIKELGIYPLNQLDTFKQILISLEDIFKQNLHCSCLLTTNNLVLNILKPLFTMYKAVRPFTILSTMEEVYMFYNKPENKLLN